MMRYEIHKYQPAYSVDKKLEGLGSQKGFRDVVQWYRWKMMAALV